MLWSIAVYKQFITAKLSLNHRPGSLGGALFNIWSWNHSCEPCQPCLLNYSNNADTIQDWVSVCCAQCLAFFFLLMHQPLFTGPAGVVCPDSRWLCRLLLPLASQMQLFGRPTDWFRCRLSLWPGLGHSCYALCAHWHLPQSRGFSPG